ncbi:hypothetical protein [Amphibacillus cookii]|uniref:hypothetical protein n=1 Tax=Amphibacillus cookii TaxID=767787 RepID=UPI00195C7819|nr:hypothetical protein [Amphibacillus cookii]MBM7542729.1 hypothetical protein [Amphibacillus cookii]
MPIGKMLENKLQNPTVKNAFAEKQKNHDIYLKQFNQNHSIKAYRKDQEKLEKVNRARKATVLNEQQKT